MALTIRDIPIKTRNLLDDYKIEWGIKTDSRALVYAVSMCHFHQTSHEHLNDELMKERKRADDADRILAGLEEYLVPALENIRQQELQL
ncbi:MAG: hypothetical protein RPU91_01750 [Candidatus Sedimenticola sp. (ex Thyasira tokunagai)]